MSLVSHLSARPGHLWYRNLVYVSMMISKCARKLHEHRKEVEYYRQVLLKLECWNVDKYYNENVDTISGQSNYNEICNLPFVFLKLIGSLDGNGWSCLHDVLHWILCFSQENGSKTPPILKPISSKRRLDQEWLYLWLKIVATKKAALLVAVF